MLKDIYTINGWYNNGLVTLLRNDRKQIPIDLNYVNKGFTWYNGSSYLDDSLYEPIDSGDDTPAKPDPQPGGDTPTVTKYNITVSNNTGGSISTNKSEVEYGGSATITIIINDEYKLSFLTINSINVTAHILNNQYVINNITEDKAVYAEFSKNTLTTPTPENPDPQDPTNPDPTEPITNEKFPVADAVDLGLPSGLKWASWNMGSSSPMDVPDTKYARYGWGDPTGEVHTNYTNDYAVSHDSKFSTHSIDIACSQYDIATTQWGNGWRLPRKADFEELISKCTIVRGTHTDDNGKSRYGYKLTGPNGKSIMIPSAGYVNSTGELRDDNSSMVYWMSSNNLGADISAQVLYTRSVQDMQAAIYYQIPIRPVYDGSSSQGSGSQSGEGPKPETPSAGNAVDLGLSVLWADRNVGSSSATAVGSYIRWGETDVPNPEVYSQDSYSLYLNNAYMVDGLLTLPAANDAASAQWGGTWRMPTFDEWSELINHCDWVAEGDGFRIYKKNSTNIAESIYLPITGYKVQDKGATATMNNNFCFYWSSTLSTTVQYKGSSAYAFIGRPSDDMYKNIPAHPRYEGMPIRPVRTTHN